MRSADSLLTRLSTSSWTTSASPKPAADAESAPLGGVGNHFGRVGGDPIQVGEHPPGRAGNAGSSRGAASQITEAITTARSCGATGEIVVRADSAFYTKR
jgi:hypothetical protein